MPVIPSVIPVKTGIHASDPARGAGMPVLPPPCPRIIPSVIPVKTGIHASDPDRGAGTRLTPPLASRPLALVGRLFRLFQDGDGAVCGGAG